MVVLELEADDAGEGVMPDEALRAHTRKGRGGRPRLADGEVRSLKIKVRLSPAEYGVLSARAQHLGMPPSRFLREAALSRRLPRPPVPTINREQYAELGRLSGNLNQLARAANSGRAVVVSDELLQQLIEEVGRLRLALIGVDGEGRP